MELKMHFSLSVASDIFEGFELVLPYPEWKRDGDGCSPEMTHADRVAAFEAYAQENGPQAYYLEEEYDEDGEENDDYDPYLWIRAAEAVGPYRLSGHAGRGNVPSRRGDVAISHLRGIESASMKRLEAASTGLAVEGESNRLR